uniref:WSN domain-containing protein n=1 Tax=Steinernema glaseri TaxID=37863 RepID=A0A1I7ZRY5_9BILA
MYIFLVKFLTLCCFLVTVDSVENNNSTYIYGEKSESTTKKANVSLHRSSEELLLQRKNPSQKDHKLEEYEDTMQNMARLGNILATAGRSDRNIISPMKSAPTGVNFAAEDVKKHIGETENKDTVIESLLDILGNTLTGMDRLLSQAHEALGIRYYINYSDKKDWP